MDFNHAIRKAGIMYFAAAAFRALSLLSLICAVSYRIYAISAISVLAAVVSIPLTARLKLLSLPPCNDAFLLQKQFDKYSRRTLNWSFFCVYLLLAALFDITRLAINSKPGELIDCVWAHSIAICFAAVMIYVNRKRMKLLTDSFEFEKTSAFRTELRRARIGSAVYTISALALFCGFEYAFVLNPANAFILVFIALCVAYNYTLMNRFTYSARRHNRFVTAVVLIAALIFGGYSYLSRDIWLTQPYINSVPNIYDSESRITYDDTTGVYTITNPGNDFRILQLTDIHLGGGVLSFDKDLAALKSVYALLEYARPDLVIVTGDLVYPLGISSFSFNNTAPVQQFAAFMRNTGIPWAFTYGNHDTEDWAATSTSDVNELYKSLSWRTTRTLLYPYTQPDISGRSNQLIELRNADGSLNQALFLIDSNAYTGAGFSKYDYIHDDQTQWYTEQTERLNAAEGRTVSSLIFMHIPLTEYMEAYELYEAGSAEVIRYFGEIGESGSRKICCSEFKSSIFEAALKLGSTKGFFCGHDHYNNISLDYKGIRLTYGMSIDYLASPGIARDTAQRGGTLITIHSDSSFDVEQIPLESIR